MIEVFQVQWSDPVTGERMSEMRYFKGDDQITPAEWAEDYAYARADKGWHDVEKLEIDTGGMNPYVSSSGEYLDTLAMTKSEAQDFCHQKTQETGHLFDWKFVGGRVAVYALMTVNGKMSGLDAANVTTEVEGVGEWA